MHPVFAKNSNLSQIKGSGTQVHTILNYTAEL